MSFGLIARAIFVPSTARHTAWLGLAIGIPLVIAVYLNFLTVDIAAAAARVGAPARSAPFCLDLPRRAGVVAVPSEVFYQRSDDGAAFARFCFAKNDDVLDLAGERLMAAFAQ